MYPSDFLATEVYLPKFLSILFVILLSNHEESQPSIFISKANIGIPTHMYYSRLKH